MARIPFRLVVSAAALFAVLLGITGCGFGKTSQADDNQASQSYEDADDALDRADNLREDFKSGDVELDDSAKGANITLLG